MTAARHMQNVLRLCAMLLPVLLGGCAETWSKPGASDADFARVNAACNARAVALFPPAVQQVIVADGDRADAPSNCSGGMMNDMMNDMMSDCGMMGANLGLPDQAMVDHNAKARAAEARNCLIASGWQLTKRN